jgi:periplasmic copper chaperone A
VQFINIDVKGAAFLSALCLAGIQSVAAQPMPGAFRAGAIVVEAPWSREAPGSMKRTAGYMSITNTGSKPDRLVGGTAAATGRFEVHHSVTSGGVTRMQAVEGGLEIKPGETVELKPGGIHAMLVDLPKGPKAGETIKGTLQFENAGALEIEYQVGGLGTQAAPKMAGAHHHH